MKRITLRKGSVIRYADTEESLDRLKKMGYKEVDAKPVTEDEKPEADAKQETDKTPEADEKPEEDKKSSGRTTKK